MLENLVRSRVRIFVEEPFPLRVPMVSTGVHPTPLSQTMLTSRQEDDGVLEIDTGPVEPYAELPWKGMMSLEVEHPSLKPHPCYFIIETDDIAIGRNPGFSTGHSS